MDNAMANLLPLATMVFALVLSIEPVQIPGYAAVAPAFTLMAAYHWTIYRPDLLSPLMLFVTGMLQDLLTGELPGVTAFLLLLAYAIVLPHRPHFINRSFPFIWAGFALIAGSVILLSWMLRSLFAGELLDPHSSIFRAVLTISGFPIASFLLGRTQRALIDTG
jgi:rod shape-determining protein MreD